MPREMFAALPADDSVATKTCRVEVGGNDVRAMAKAKTMSSRQFQRTNSPKPSRTVGVQGLEMDTLIAEMSGDDVVKAREAASTVRNALKSSPADTRTRLLSLGGIEAFIGLLKSVDQETVEHAIAALLHLSLSDGTEPVISRNQGLESVVEVLKSGSPTARETAAAAIFTLTPGPESRERVRRAGGVPALVEMLQAGSLRGKKDAALALFNLAAEEACARDLIAEGAPAALFHLLNTEMEPGLEDKVMAVVANLAKSQAGRQAVAEIEGSVESLVEVVQGGSNRSKEDAVVALFLLATHVPQVAQKVRSERATQALTRLSQAGTPRAKSKAKSLLELLRNSPGLGSAASASS